MESISIRSTHSKQFNPFARRSQSANSTFTSSCSKSIQINRTGLIFVYGHRSMITAKLIVAFWEDVPICKEWGNSSEFSDEFIESFNRVLAPKLKSINDVSFPITVNSFEIELLQLSYTAIISAWVKHFRTAASKVVLTVTQEAILQMPHGGSKFWLVIRH